MRIMCEVCKVEGYLQQLGNYYRVRHYEGKGENGKGKFYYHQQTREYVEKHLNSKVSNETNVKGAIGQSGQVSVQESIDPDKLKLSLEYGNSKCGRRLVWFRTQAFQACDPGFKSRRPHHIKPCFHAEAEHTFQPIKKGGVGVQEH